MILESTGGFAGETATLLQSLAKLVDSRENLPPRTNLANGRFFSLLKRFVLPSVRSAQCPAARSLTLHMI